jgi:hypothetical protein
MVSRREKMIEPFSDKELFGNKFDSIPSIKSVVGILAII